MNIIGKNEKNVTNKVINTIGKQNITLINNCINNYKNIIYTITLESNLTVPESEKEKKKAAIEKYQLDKRYYVQVSELKSNYEKIEKTTFISDILSNKETFINDKTVLQKFENLLIYNEIKLINDYMISIKYLLKDIANNSVNLKYYQDIDNQKERKMQNIDKQIEKYTLCQKSNISTKQIANILNDIDSSYIELCSCLSDSKPHFSFKKKNKNFLGNIYIDSVASLLDYYQKFKSISDDTMDKNKKIVCEYTIHQILMMVEFILNYNSKIMEIKISDIQSNYETLKILIDNKLNKFETAFTSINTSDSLKEANEIKHSCNKANTNKNINLTDEQEYAFAKNYLNDEAKKIIENIKSLKENWDFDMKSVVDEALFTQKHIKTKKI